MRVRYMAENQEVLNASPYVITDPEVHRGQWKKMLQRDQLGLEIGCGLGRFLREMAHRSEEDAEDTAQGSVQGYGWIGLERIGTILAKASQRLEAEEKEREVSPALRLIRGDAQLLTSYFADGEIDRIYLNFSDPWPKKHHAKRRLTSDRFLPLYRKLLAKEGILQMKTDNDALFAFSVASLREQGWTITQMTDDLHASEYERGNVMTEYEMKFSSAGKNIHYLQALPPQAE